MTRRVLLAAAAGLLSPSVASARIEEGESVWCAALSPDGRLLAAGCESGTIYLWDTRTEFADSRSDARTEFAASGSAVAAGKPLRTLRGHADAVFGAAFSADGALLVSAARGKPGVRIWETGSGKAVRDLDPHRGWVWAARFSPDGSRLATCGGDPFVRVFDAKSGEPRFRAAGHRGAVKRVAWTADGRRLLSGGDDGLLHIWDGESGESQHALPCEQSWLESVAAGPGVIALTAGGDGTVRVWDTGAGTHVRTFAGRVPDLSCLAVSPDGKIAATGGADRSMRLWDVNTGEQLFRQNMKGSVLDVGFDGGGGRLLAVVRGDAARLWDVPARTEVGAYRRSPADVESASSVRGRLMWSPRTPFAAG